MGSTWKRSSEVLKEKRMIVKPRRDDSGGKYYVALETVFPEFVDVNLVDLRDNHFEIVRWIADFSTKLLDANLQPHGEGNSYMPHFD